MTTTSNSHTTNVLRYLIAAVITCVLVASLTFVSTPASACVTKLNKPYKVTGRVRALAANDNCNPDLFLLDRQRWWGWQAVVRPRVPHDSSVIMTGDCAKLRGTYTYRASYGTSLHYHNGPTARLTC